MNNSYFISTGNADAERLRICNKIYNKETFKFLLESGLKSGMKVLELGCGFGHSAIWLAKQVLPDGVVYAIDISLDNLAIAEENAQKENIHNIKFICMDANDLVDKFPEKIDFFYGRWVLEFCPDRKQILKSIHSLLNDGGIFTYEGSNFIESGGYVYPEHQAVYKWHQLGALNAERSGCEVHFARKIYSELTSLGYHKISAKHHQPVLTTPEEKSVYKLGLMSIKNSWIKNQVMTSEEIDKLIDEFIDIEKDDERIIGFFNNILICGIK